MRIWVMRHGEASFNAKTDNQRTLTEHGQKTAFKQGQWLAKRFSDQQVSLDKILVSPYQRTQQTLEQVLAGMQAVSSVQSFANVARAVESWDGITPGGHLDNVLNYLDFLRSEGAKNVLLISHLPLVYNLTQALTHFQHSVHFYPAVIAEIDWQTDNSKLIVAEFP